MFSYTFTNGKDDFTIGLTISPIENKAKGTLNEIYLSNKRISISFKPNNGVFGTAKVDVNETSYSFYVNSSFMGEARSDLFKQIIINVWNGSKDEIHDESVFADVTEDMENLAMELQDFKLCVEPFYIPSFFATHELSYKIDSFHYKVINDFQKSGIVKGDREHAFIINMMREFEIGNNFSISNKSDVAEINILDERGNNMPLSFKGTGSVRMFFMLLILATCLRKQVQSQIIPIITIEEPEQNLHPMMQSKLAYLFSDFSKLSHPQTKLFIETHSEYLIRKTQVMAKKFCNEGNAIENFEFKTYYFPSSDDVKRKPYDMRYCEDGRFYERFGFGFFDEAAELAMQIF